MARASCALLAVRLTARRRDSPPRVACVLHWRWSGRRTPPTACHPARYDFDSVAYSPYAGYVVRGAPWDITDAPRFAHRGLMVDTARHFQPLASLRKVVDALPYAKLNGPSFRHVAVRCS